LLCADKAAGAEVVIVLDDKAHLKVILWIRARWVCSLIGDWGLFLGLENLFKMLATVARLEESGGNDEAVEFTFVLVASTLLRVREREGRDGVRARAIGEAERGVSV
jgi:hypothetical protein